MTVRRLASTPLLIAGALAQTPPHAVSIASPHGLSDMAVVKSADTLHVFGRTGGIAIGFVHYARSRDAGRTWPVQQVPIGFLAGFWGAAASGDHVYALGWYDWVGPYVIPSHDGGTTWIPPVRVSQQLTSTLGVPAALHADGLTVNVVWADPRSTGHVWANRSLDGGLTWQATDARLDAGVIPPSSPQYSIELVGDGPVINAFWGSFGASGTLHQRSVDGGATWLPAPNALLGPRMLRAAGSGPVLVVADETGGAARSADGGATWAPVTGHGIVHLDDLAVSDSHVLLIGRQSNTVSPIPMQINVSADGGATWLPAPYVVLIYMVHEMKAAASDALWVHVRSLTQIPPNGAVIQSDDGGVSWRLTSEEIGRGFWAWPGHALAITKTGWNGTDYLAWVMAGHTPLGTGTPGTGGLVPTLEGSGLPTLGRTYSLEVGSALPNALGAVFASFEQAAPMTVGSATVWVQQPAIPTLLVTSAAGQASLHIALPNLTAFAGLTITSQAFVLDSASVDGFTATRALETWIK